jgi:two-component system, NarL family, response regulator LiaR
MSGLEATRRTRAMTRPPCVLLLTAHDDVDYVIAAIEVGASGYLLKTARAADVVAAIWAVAQGEVVLHSGLARELARADRERRCGPLLSDREVEVLALAARGLANKQIAAVLSVSVRTVEAQLTSVFNRLGAVNRAEAVARASAPGAAA